MVVVCLQETGKKAFRLVRRYFNQSPAVLLTVCAQPEYSQSQPTDVGGATRVGQWISSCDRCDLKSLVEDTTTVKASAKYCESSYGALYVVLYSGAWMSNLNWES